MKREILCSQCNDNSLRHLGFPVVDRQYGTRIAFPIGPTEHYKTVRGTCVRSLQCDTCGLPLEKGHTAIAISTWIDGQEYFSWEDEYVTQNLQSQD